MAFNKPTGMQQFHKGPKMSPDARLKLAADMEKLKIDPPEIPNLPNASIQEAAPIQVAGGEAVIAKAATKKDPKKRAIAAENTDSGLQLMHWRFEKGDVEALKEIAEAQHGTVNKLVRAIISEWLEKNGKK